MYNYGQYYTMLLCVFVKFINFKFFRVFVINFVRVFAINFVRAFVINCVRVFFIICVRVFVINFVRVFVINPGFKDTFLGSQQWGPSFQRPQTPLRDVYV